MWEIKNLDTGEVTYIAEAPSYHHLRCFCATSTEGVQYWYLDGGLHRKNGPAATFYDGEQWWCLKNIFHRVSGPAVVRSDGSTEWYLNGKIVDPPKEKDNE